MEALVWQPSFRQEFDGFIRMIQAGGQSYEVLHLPHCGNRTARVEVTTYKFNSREPDIRYHFNTELRLIGVSIAVEKEGLLVGHKLYTDEDWREF